MWGDAAGGKLGLEAEPDEPVLAPLLVETPMDGRVVDIEAGCDVSVALTSRGSVFAWGEERYAGLGSVVDNSESGWTTPRFMATLLGERVISISMRYKYGVAVCASGTVYAWGCFANSASGSELRPVKIEGLPNTGITKVRGCFDFDDARRFFTYAEHLSLPPSLPPSQPQHRLAPLPSTSLFGRAKTPGLYSPCPVQQQTVTCQASWMPWTSAWTRGWTPVESWRIARPPLASRG